MTKTVSDISAFGYIHSNRTHQNRDKYFFNRNLHLVGDCISTHELDNDTIQVNLNKISL